MESNSSSVFIRQFLLFLVYANISATSGFHLEAAKEARRSPSVRERGPVGYSVSGNQIGLPPDNKGGGGGRKQPSLSSYHRLLTTRSTPATARTKPLPAESGFRSRTNNGADDERGKRRRARQRYDAVDRRPVARKGGRRRASSRDCWKQLDLNIDVCLVDYERMLRNSTLKNRQQLSEAFKIAFCRSYEETMDCLHLSFVNCPPGGVHLNKVNLRIGHLRTDMEQLCDELDKNNGDDDGDDDGDLRNPQIETRNGRFPLKISTNSTTFSRHRVAPQSSSSSSGTAPSTPEAVSPKDSPSPSTKPYLLASLVRTTPIAHSTTQREPNHRETTLSGVLHHFVNQQQQQQQQQQQCKDDTVDCGRGEHAAMEGRRQTAVVTVNNSVPAPHSGPPPPPPPPNRKPCSNRSVTEVALLQEVITNPAFRNSDDLSSQSNRNIAAAAAASAADSLTVGRNSEQARQECRTDARCSATNSVGIASKSCPVVLCLTGLLMILLIDG